MKDRNNTCCFFGHRKITITDDLVNRVTQIVENLITEENVSVFLFGSKSDFNSLCRDVVTELKIKYPHIKRIYIRAEFPYIDDSYYEYLLERYDDTYYPTKMINAGNAAYVERNCEMIDNSRFCVIYYDENYMPRKRRKSKKDIIEYQPKSGTRIAYEYAKKKNNIIMNCI